MLTSKERKSAKESNCLCEDCRIGKWRKSFVQYEVQVEKPNKELYKLGGRGDGGATHINTLTFRRRIKSRLPFAGIVRRLPYSTRFQDKR